MRPASTGGEAKANLRLLLTGFFDWQDLGSPPELSRSRENPSGRLLMGGGETDGGAAASGRGALAEMLDGAWQREARVEVSVEVLPVVWDVARRLSYDRYDVVIHMGLGVYDHDDVLLLERGAFHRREGLDARGVSPATASFVPGLEVDQVIRAPAWLDAGLEALDGLVVEGYRVTVKDARADNVFLCNETHARALISLADQARGAGPLAAYFIHLPRPRGANERALALGVKSLIGSLVAQVHQRASRRAAQDAIDGLKSEPGAAGEAEIDEG